MSATAGIALSSPSYGSGTAAMTAAGNSPPTQDRTDRTPEGTEIRTMANTDRTIRNSPEMGTAIPHRRT
ncbi:hypothetical protein [Streptomyces uncialis]|uniref:hypothetical protein n=1 Tax=Streptomyces uncialis TaxID=1048205 RepID=UPI0033C4B454